jgi:hypothetical protein
MRNIEPITIWKNGESKVANTLDAYIVNDNLQSMCIFYWIVLYTDEDTKGEALEQGNVTLDGELYQNWDGSNDSAFAFIAQQLNLTLI